MALTQYEQLELLRLAEEADIEASKTNYVKYVEYVHGGRWLPGRVHKYVCNEIQKFIQTDTGNAYDILVFSMPPQHGKSMMVTETLPSWYLGKYPFKRVIEVSYNEDFSKKFGRRNKQKIEEHGKKIFDIEISTNVDRADEFELSNNVGGMISRGIMSGITGNPGNLIVIDDPIKNRKEADSPTIRETQKDEWRESIKTRLAAKAKVILIMTRWHEDDLAGYILDTEENVTVINLPCEAEEDDVLGRNPGDSLAPELGKNNEWLQQFKKSYNTIEGSRSWLALFQGRPSAQEGNILKRHWFKYWKPKGLDLPPVTIKMNDGTLQNIYAEDFPDHVDEECQSWDCAFKRTEDNDYVSGGIISRRLGCFYLKDLINERMDIIQTMQAIEIFAEKHPKATRKLIEGKANGPAIIQMLHRKMPGLIEIEPEGGKEARVSAIAPVLESGNFYVPHPHIAGWVAGFIDQCCNFPNAAHDDMVDMMSQGLNQLYFHSRDTYKEDLIKQGGTYTYGELQMMGFKEFQIRKMAREGKIKLIGMIKKHA